MVRTTKVAITSVLIIALILHPVYSSNASGINVEPVDNLQLEGQEVKFDYKNYPKERKLALQYFLEKYKDDKLFSGTKTEAIGVYLFDIDNDGEQEIFAYIDACNKGVLLSCPLVILKKPSQETGDKKYRVIPWYTTGREVDNLMRFTDGSTKILKKTTLGYHNIITGGKDSTSFGIWEWMGTHYKISKMIDKDESSKDVIVSRGEFDISTEFLHNGSISKDNKEEGVRNITISGLELNIPRNFLIGSSARESDKDDKSILFAFTYPEIQGGMGNGYDFIQVFCEDLREYFKKDGVTHSQHLVDQYWNDYLDIDKEDEIYKIIYEDFSGDLGRKHYRIKDYGSELDIEKIIKGMKESPGLSEERENMLRKSIAKLNEKFRKRLSGEFRVHYKNVYTNDDPEAPEDYIICDKRRRNTKSFCESAFFYKDLFIEVHFSRNSLKEFNNIKEETLQLIKQWENKNYENK